MAGGEEKACSGFAAVGHPGFKLFNATHLVVWTRGRPCSQIQYIVVGPHGWLTLSHLFTSSRAHRPRYGPHTCLPFHWTSAPSPDPRKLPITVHHDVFQFQGMFHFRQNMHPSSPTSLHNRETAWLPSSSARYLCISEVLKFSSSTTQNRSTREFIPKPVIMTNVDRNRSSFKTYMHYCILIYMLLL